MSSKSTAFVIDPNPRHRQALTSMLGSMEVDVRVYASGEEYWSKFDPDLPGCVILDLHIAAAGRPLRELLAAGPLAPSLVFISAEKNVATVVRALRRPGTEFLQQGAYSELDLWEAVQAAIAYDRHNRENYAARQRQLSKLESLTDGERQVLRLLLRGMTNQAIAQSSGVSRAAVEARRARMMKKLGATNLIALIRCALEAGFDADSALDEPPPM